MPLVIGAYTDFEVAFPGSAHLLPLQFQIAQKYWSSDKKSESMNWLNSIIDDPEAVGTYYYRLAKARATVWKGVKW